MTTATETPRAELTDFVGAWEMRFLEVVKPYLDPQPELFEATRLAQFTDSSCIAIAVEPGREYPPRSGYFQCNVIAEYNYRGTKDEERISRIWGQLLEALGYGHNGESPLRTRLPQGRLKIIGGIDAVTYDGQILDDMPSRIRQFNFTTWLGMLAES